MFKFKFRLIASAAVLSICTVASAQQSTLTREAVIAEFLRAQTAGEIPATGYTFWDRPGAVSARAGALGRPFAGATSREAVTAELARARRAGEIPASGEAWDGTLPVSSKAGAFGRAFDGGGLSRDAVVTDMAKARASGDLQQRQLQDYVGGP